MIIDIIIICTQQDETKEDAPIAHENPTFGNIKFYSLLRLKLYVKVLLYV